MYQTSSCEILPCNMATVFSFDDGVRLSHHLVHQDVSRKFCLSALGDQLQVHNLSPRHQLLTIHLSRFGFSLFFKRQSIPKKVHIYMYVCISICVVQRMSLDAFFIVIFIEKQVRGLDPISISLSFYIQPCLVCVCVGCRYDLQTILIQLGLTIKLLNSAQNYLLPQLQLSQRFVFCLIVVRTFSSTN